MIDAQKSSFGLNHDSDEHRADVNSESKQPQIPAVSLPKGGGALKSIDEKFSVNAVNGTSTLSIPLPLSKSRSDFGPSLALSYNSGAGNSEFGLGWSLDLPFIQRKTDKRLPAYQDALDSDVFLFSGAEDLVPVLQKDEKGCWCKHELTTGDGIKVKYFRPRVESHYSRIEQVKVINESGFYWKVTTRDNTVTFYGRSPQARIADPEDDSRIFKWLPELSYDDKGNCLEYIYVQEDMENVPFVPHEKNRHNGLAFFTNKYLKRIKYGNTNPYYRDENKPYNPGLPGNPGYLFEVVFDYHDHDEAQPLPAPQKKWSCRHAPFSNHRSGFEIRTYRLCRRIMLFHHFKELGNGSGIEPYLVRSLDINYRYFKSSGSNLDAMVMGTVEADFIESIRLCGYLKDGSGNYRITVLPPTEFEYNELLWNKDVRSISAENAANAPVGLANNYQWVNIFNEGISGILTEQGNAWHYKQNLGDGSFSSARPVIPKPSLQGVANGSLLITDIEAKGKKYLVSNQPSLAGYYEQAPDGDWLPFRHFEQNININFSDPNVKFIDLNGDGTADVIISEDEVFTWYPAEGSKGYGPPQLERKPYDEERGPRIVFADPAQTIFLADMNGDGLTDIVRIRNGEVCYWPNLGYGRFGAKVTMSNAPCFDTPDAFNPAYLHLADISGTGATDMVYLGQNRFRAWVNHGGNAWSQPWEIEGFPSLELPNQLSVVDLLGNGTSCIVWSSPLPAGSGEPMRYIDLMGGKKPYLLNKYKNNLGKVTSIAYKGSTYYCLKDKKAGRPWLTKLPFPVQCVSRVVVKEEVTQSCYVNEYSYHHGYYDHQEREFRGFGMVEQTDTETYDHFVRNEAANIVNRELRQAPVITKTWYHTGAFFDRKNILKQFANEYYKNTEFNEHHLPEVEIDIEMTGELTPEEFREAVRACKGRLLRQEIYAADGSEQSKHPYIATEHNFHIKVLQPKVQNRHAVFSVQDSEVVTYHYERNPADPRITHSLNLKVDRFGNVLQAVSAVYSRVLAGSALPAEVREEQSRVQITYNENTFTNDINLPSAYRLPLPAETTSYELTGIKQAEQYFNPAKLRDYLVQSVTIKYHEKPAAGNERGVPQDDVKDTPGVVNKRIIKQVRTLYRKNSISGALPLGEMDSLGLVYETYKLAFTSEMLHDIYHQESLPGAGPDDTMMAEGRYRKSSDLISAHLFPSRDSGSEWWIPSGITAYPANPELHFYLPDRYIDPFGNITRVKYDRDYHLYVEETEDSAGNRTKVEKFNFRVLMPELVKDPNNNYAEVRFDLLGQVVGTALKGKGNEADDFDGFEPCLSQSHIDAFFNAPLSHGADLLGHATSRFIYDFSRLPVTKNG